MTAGEAERPQAEPTELEVLLEVLSSGEELPGRRSTGDEDVVQLRRLVMVAREGHRLLLRFLQDPYIVTDPEGRIRQVNEAGVRLLGAGSPSDLAGRPVEELVTEARRPRFRDRLERLAEDREVDTFQIVVCPRNRQPVPLEAIATPVRDCDGTVMGIQWLLRDIQTERRAEQTTRQLVRSEAERAAAERAEKRLRILSEASRILSEYLEGDEPLQKVAELVVREHADYCSIWLQMDEVLREVASAGSEAGHPGFLPLRRRLLLDPDDPESALSRAVSRGTPHVVAEEDPSGEMMEVRPAGGGEADSGAAGPRRALAVPLVGSRRIEGALVLADAGVGPGFGREDLVLAGQLADRILMAEEQAHLYRAAVTARGERDHLRRVVSHDLRNALNAVVVSLEQAALTRDVPLGRPGETGSTGAASDAAESGDDARSSSATGTRSAGENREGKWLVRAHRAARRMSRLIEDLDQLEELGTSSFELEATPCEPELLLRDAVEMFKGKAERKDIRLRWEVDPDTPPVSADRERIGQVLSNLMENALKFTPPGGQVTLRGSAGEKEAVFSVEDTGPGIPEEELPRIFDRFWTRERAGVGGGSGLGLASARELVEAHGGTVRAESPPGAGARISFTLPIARSADQA